MKLVRNSTIFLSIAFIVFFSSQIKAFNNTNILVEESVNHIYQQRYKQAYQALKKAYEQSPRHPGVHFNLGRLFELTRNFPEALKEYRIAASLDSSMVSARRGLARCIVELKRERLTEQKRDSKVKQQPAPIVSINNKHRVIQQNSIPQQPVFQKQNVIVSAQPMPTVRRQFSEPKLPSLPVRMIADTSKKSDEAKAEALLNSGKTAKAIILLNKTLEKNPNSPTSHYLMGKALYVTKDLFASIKHLEEALRVNSKYYEAYLLLGKNYAKVNLLDDAIKNYKTYYAVRPQSQVALEIARVYEKMKKPMLAKEYYYKANAVNPGNPSLQRSLSASNEKVATNLYLRGNHAFAMKNYKEANRLFEQALAINALQGIYQNDALQKAETSRINQLALEKSKVPARRGFITSRKSYGTVDLKYYQLADINFKTRFTGPITVEWRAKIAKKFVRYGRDFLLMIKELSQDELDVMNRDTNNYRLNSHYNNQPVFLVTARKGTLPVFMKKGALVNMTGQTDWKQYSIINDVGQSVKLPAFDFISAFP